LLVAPILVAVVGCSGNNADVATGSSAQDVTIGSLDGKTFVSTGVTGHTLVPGSEVTIAFSNGAVRASAGCNSMGGSVTIIDGVLGGGESFSSTLMGCSDDLAAQDTWLAAFLAAAPTLVLDGDTLTMTAKDATITLTSQASSTMLAPLVGTTWTLEGIVAVTAQSVSSLPTGVEPPTLVLGSDGQAAIATGCNTGGASYSTDGQTISFGPVRMTKRSCVDDDAESVQAAVVAVLDGDVTFTIEGSRLTLTKGDQGLMYRAP
jgi:heat shock protein HslJ